MVWPNPKADRGYDLCVGYFLWNLFDTNWKHYCGKTDEFYVLFEFVDLADDWHGRFHQREEASRCEYGQDSRGVGLQGRHCE